MTAAQRARRQASGARQKAWFAADRAAREDAARSPEGRALLLAAQTALFPPGHPLAQQAATTREDVTP